MFKKACALAFIAVLIGFFFFIQDADIVTYWYDIYRRQLVTNSFEGKTVWIIGASSGIGECLTYDMVQNGASKVIISARREKELKRVQTSANNISNPQKQKIYTKTLDLIRVLDDAYSKSFISELYLEHPDIDIVIFNAGLAQRSQASETSIKTVKRIFDINAFSTISVINSVINNGINLNNTERHYQFIATSSITAITGEPYGSSVSASKAALTGYFASLQLELIKYNVDFTIVYPGIVKTDLKSNAYIKGDNTESTYRYDDDERYNENEVVSCSRLAQLYSTAVYAQLRYAWISKQPFLIFAYIFQYFSYIVAYIQRLAGPSFL